MTQPLVYFRLLQHKRSMRRLENYCEAKCLKTAQTYVREIDLVRLNQDICPENVLLVKISQRSAFCCRLKLKERLSMLTCKQL